MIAFSNLGELKFRLKKMKNKYLILLILVPLSEMKALFYNSGLKVSWYLFSDNTRYLCNVIEDYSNIFIFGVVFYYLAFVKIDITIRKICLFLFVLNALDLIHLGLMDCIYFVPLKLLLTLFALKICIKLKLFSIY